MTADRRPRRSSTTPPPWWLGPSGNIFIADSVNNVIREVNIATGIITTVAGNGGGGGEATAVTAARQPQPSCG